MILFYKLKNKAKQISERTGNPADVDFYKQCKNSLRLVICQAKIDYLRDSVAQCKQSPQKAAYMWSCINNVIGRSNSPSSPISTSSLDCINEFFQTVSVISQHRSANCFCTPSLGDNNGFSFDEITTSAVLSRMNKLDVKKLTDLAGLSAFFSKEIANEIVVPLTNLFNHSLRDGIVPAA